MSINELIAAREKADAALAAAGDDLKAELVAAKTAYRADPTDDTRARRDAASARVQAWRAAIRSGRGGVNVGGDAAATDPSEG